MRLPNFKTFYYSSVIKIHNAIYYTLNPLSQNYIIYNSHENLFSKNVNYKHSEWNRNLQFINTVEQIIGEIPYKCSDFHSGGKQAL